MLYIPKETYFELKAPDRAFLRQEFGKIDKIFNTIFNEQNGICEFCRIGKELAPQKEKDHNCLGCNFLESLQMIRHFNITYEHVNTKFSFLTYTTYLYYLVVKMEEVFGLLHIPEDYRGKKFEVFYTIKRWTNFFKHPKSFALTHHPIYIFEDAPNFKKSTKSKILFTQKDIDRYYRANNEKLEKELFKKVSNNPNIVVKLPKLTTLTEEFCLKCKEFVDLILSSPAYKHTLSTQTNFLDYYSTEQHLQLHQSNLLI